MKEKLFEELKSRRFSDEDARLIVSAINLIVDNTAVDFKSAEMQQLIYSLQKMQ